MDKMKAEDLIKKIDEKIVELDKQENPIELLKRALIKKGIIKDKNLSADDIEKIFNLIKENINKK